MSLPERNTSISYHLTNQPGAGPTASRGLRETPDLCLLLFAGIPRLLQSTTVARGVCGWYVGTYLFCFFSGLSSFLFVRRFLGRSRVFRGFRHFRGFPVFCPRVASSSQLRKLDGNLPIWVVRGSPPVVSWHTLDGNLPIWVVRGSPPVVKWPTLDGNPAILRRGPALRAMARRELLGSAVPLGLPFDLN